MRSQRGFTTIELIVVIIVAAFVAGLFWVQKSDVKLRGEDTTRKQDMNAIYYYLEDVYYPKHKGYPSTLEANMLKGLDPESLRDPDGNKISTEGSDYSYKPINCRKNICKEYTLSAELAKEAPFTKTNRNHQ